MNKDIFNPEYWANRIRAARYPHHSIFLCPLDKWQRIEANHKKLLAGFANSSDSVLDVGCGYGRLLSLMPAGWEGDYTGVDLSPSFIDQALHDFPKHEFICGDIREVLPTLPKKYDIAIAISMRPMIVGNAGEEVWLEIYAAIKGAARSLLFLEYVEDDAGELIVFD